MGHTWLEALHPQVACIFNALSLALTANTESVSNKVLSTHTHSYTLSHIYAWSIAHLIHLTQTFSFIYRIILRVAFCFLFWFSSFFFFFWAANDFLLLQQRAQLPAEFTHVCR